MGEKGQRALILMRDRVGTEGEVKGVTWFKLSLAMQGRSKLNRNHPKIGDDQESSSLERSYN